MFMILNIIHRGTVFSLSTALMRITVVSVLIFLEIQMGETHLQDSYDDLMLKTQSKTYQEKCDTRQFIDFYHNRGN